jgi:hypothetical protein
LLRAPPEEPRIEGARARGVAGTKFEVDDRVGETVGHVYLSGPLTGAKLSADKAMSFDRGGGPDYQSNDLGEAETD